MFIEIRTIKAKAIFYWCKEILIDNSSNNRLSLNDLILKPGEINAFLKIIYNTWFPTRKVLFYYEDTDLDSVVYFAEYLVQYLWKSLKSLEK